MDALNKWQKLAPPPTPPTSPLIIEPTLMHANPNNFHRGCNMTLDSGGYMPGKVPVMVIPCRPEDIKRYKKKGTTINALWHKLSLP